MEFGAALAANLTSPPVLAFALGFLATALGAELKLHEALYDALSVYLLLAIGLKGGVAISVAEPGALLWPALAALALGTAIPLWCYAVLRRLLRLGAADSGALAAHYGSVSAVTFVAALQFLAARGVPAEGFLPALVALLEVPAIVVAIALARAGGAAGGGGGLREALHEVVFGRSVVLLVGGLAIGVLTGERGYAAVKPLFSDLFLGALVLFLLELGVVASRRRGDLRRAGAPLVAFAVIAPIVHAALASLLGPLVGLSPGGTMVFATLAASASYIAAPAAVRLALPEASPSLYLASSLVVTFPFNLALGLPLYDAFARLAHRLLG